MDAALIRSLDGGTCLDLPTTECDYIRVPSEPIDAAYVVGLAQVLGQCQSDSNTQQAEYQVGDDAVCVKMANHMLRCMACGEENPSGANIRYSAGEESADKNEWRYCFTCLDELVHELNGLIEGNEALLLGPTL